MKNYRKINIDDRWKTYLRDGFKCVACGSEDELTIDHIYPFSKGGKCHIDNYQTLCFKCNLQKSDKSQEYFLYKVNRNKMLDTYGIPDQIFKECLNIGEEELGLDFSTEKSSDMMLDKVISMCKDHFNVEFVKDSNMAISLGIKKAKEVQNEK